MVSFKLAAFLAATTFVACALAAPVPHGAANVALSEALARRSGTSVRPQAARIQTDFGHQLPGKDESLRSPPMDEARSGRSRPNSRRPDSPRPKSLGTSTSRLDRSRASGGSSRGNRVLETIPERPSRGAVEDVEDSGEDQGQ